MSIRQGKRLVKAKPTLEGAGVHLRRAFGFGNTADFDPFLLLNNFRNDVRGLLTAVYDATFPPDEIGAAVPRRSLPDIT